MRIDGRVSDGKRERGSRSLRDDPECPSRAVGAVRVEVDCAIEGPVQKHVFQTSKEITVSEIKNVRMIRIQLRPHRAVARLLVKEICAHIEIVAFRCEVEPQRRIECPFDGCAAAYDRQHPSGQRLFKVPEVKESMRTGPNDLTSAYTKVCLLAKRKTFSN